MCSEQGRSRLGSVLTCYLGLREGIWDSAMALKMSMQITPLDLETSLPFNYLVGGAEGVASTEFCTK